MVIIAFLFGALVGVILQCGRVWHFKRERDTALVSRRLWREQYKDVVRCLDELRRECDANPPRLLIDAEK